MHETKVATDASQVAEVVFNDWERRVINQGIATANALFPSLRQHYPDWNVILTPETTSLVSYAKAGHAQVHLDTQHQFFHTSRAPKPLKGRTSKEPVEVNEKVFFGKYDYTWKDYSFIVYQVRYIQEYRSIKEYYVLSKRSDFENAEIATKTVDDLISAAYRWSLDLREEVLVFDQQEWEKDKELYRSVQSTSWADVILDEDTKQSLIQDVEGFFDNQAIYEEFAVPWKRGVIFHGTPGNGKTLSLRALMKSLASRPQPIPTLYVKSLAGCGNHFYAIRQIFQQARQSAPCLLVFEDLDSLVEEKVKSFFLNEVDGLEDNNGLMMIGSTNYLERLDPALANRPSRFDRKYHFALPSLEERIQYCKYWRSKLAKTKQIEFPEKLCTTIAEATDGFSFAYLKEGFVTALLMIVGSQKLSEEKKKEYLSATGEEAGEFDHILLWRIIKNQIQTLKTEMEAAQKAILENQSKPKAKADDEADDEPRCGVDCPTCIKD